MKKGGANRGVEYIFKLFLNERFEAAIKVARQVVGLPARGIKTERQWWMWEHGEFIDSIEFYDEVDKLAADFNVPIILKRYLEGCLLFDINEKALSLIEPQIVRILPPRKAERDDGVEGYLQTSKTPYVKILVFRNGSKSDILKYIEKNWDQVEYWFNKQGARIPKKVRRVVNKDMIRRIKEFWRKPIGELRSLVDKKEPGFNHDRTPKDLLVQILLKSEFNRTIHEGYIRKIGAIK